MQWCCGGDCGGLAGRPAGRFLLLLDAGCHAIKMLKACITDIFFKIYTFISFNSGAIWTLSAKFSV